MGKAKKAWGGRFGERTDTQVEAYTASIPFDWRLYPYDVQGSVAPGDIERKPHAEAVHRPGWPDEQRTIDALLPEQPLAARGPRVGDLERGQYHPVTQQPGHGSDVKANLHDIAVFHHVLLAQI